MHTVVHTHDHHMPSYSQYYGKSVVVTNPHLPGQPVVVTNSHIPPQNQNIQCPHPHGFFTHQHVHPHTLPSHSHHTTP